jgi:hypothetical protein
MKIRIFLCIFLALGSSLCQGASLSNIGAPVTLGNILWALDWCDNCSLFAVGGTIINGQPQGILQLYSFDPENPVQPTPILDTPIQFGESVYCISWCPICTFFAAGGVTNNETAGMLQVYSFNSETQTVQPVGNPYTESNAIFISLAWSSDCHYLITGGGTMLEVFYFDPENPGDLVLTYSLETSTLNIDAISFDVNSNLVATSGYYQNVDNNGFIAIYTFDSESAEQLSLITSETIGSSSEEIVTVAWRNDGEYIAAGGYTSNSNFLHLCHFDHETQELTQLQTLSLEFSPLNVAWCSTGNYLTAIGSSNGTGYLSLYSFNTSTHQLSLQRTILLGFTGYFGPWCDCNYLATAGIQGIMVNGALQTFKLNIITAPTNLHGQQYTNHFPTQIDLINKICWGAVTDAVAYHVYSDIDLTKQLANITNQPYCYTQHQIKPGSSSTYYITALDAYDNESEAASITVS